VLTEAGEIALRYGRRMLALNAALVEAVEKDQLDLALASDTQIDPPRSC